MIWAGIRHKFNLYTDLGVRKVNLVHQYVLVANLSIGGLIIRESKGKILLENGYVLWRTTPTSNKTAEVDRGFWNFTKEYSSRTATSLQKDLLEGKFGQELVRQSRWTKLMAKTVCEAHVKLQHLQNTILKNLPDIGRGEERGKVYELVGDAILEKTCRRIKSYNIS